MRIDAQKIRSGLVRFKQMMIHSGIPSNRVVHRNSFVTSMDNPLGPGPMPPSNSNRNRQGGGPGNSNGSVNGRAMGHNNGQQSPYQFSPGNNMGGQQSPYQASPNVQYQSVSHYHASPVVRGPAVPGPVQPNFYGYSPGNQPANLNHLQPMVSGQATNFYCNGQDSTSNNNNAPSTEFYSNVGTIDLISAPPPSTLPSLKTAVTEFYSNRTDQQVNQQLDVVVEESNGKAEVEESSVQFVPGPLAIQKDLQLYEDFLRLEAMRTPMPESQPGLKNLGNGDYALERDTAWHKSAHLMELLIMYYRKHYFEKDIPVTFSQFITSLSAQDLGQIWKAPNEGYTGEYIRRFVQGVRYLTPEKAEKYNVIAKGGVLYWAKWGDNKPLDTTIEDFFKRKHEDTPYLVQDILSIWVLSKEDKLYTHPAKVHRFHHSSFTSGDLIRCGGDWEVVDGKIQWISARSGHYMPGFDYFQNAVKTIANKFGVNANSFKIKVYEPPVNGKKNEVLLPASQLLYDFNRIRDNYMLA